MPWVPFEAGGIGPLSHEEQHPTYLCDWPGCENAAEHVQGCVKELGACVALCTQHAKGGGPSQGAAKPGRHTYRPVRGF
jgi:hypothetical protein